MTLSTISGYPRIGRKRQLKWATERYWSGKKSAEELLESAAQLRQDHWLAQRDAGIDLVPVNDFSLYDQMLDMTVLLGAVPSRFGDWDEVGLDTYFRMARGEGQTGGVAALDMTKWFDTNYHYLVPELTPDQTFRVGSTKPFDELSEARAVGLEAKVILIGPITFLRLSEMTAGDPLELLDKLLPVYAEIIAELASGGAKWIELHEPVLAKEYDPATDSALARAYAYLTEARSDINLLVHVPYGDPGEYLPTLRALPVDGLGFDFTRSPGLLERLTSEAWNTGKMLSAGFIDGRNIWINDLQHSLAHLDKLAELVGQENLLVTTSCSLLHVPYDVELETHLDPELRSWLSFAQQKLTEIALLSAALNEGSESITEKLGQNHEINASANQSRSRNDPTVKERVAQLTSSNRGRSVTAAERARIQQQEFSLPPLPTTTIGSFPQTAELRSARKRLDSGELTTAEYDQIIADSIKSTINYQVETGLDVLVHGEPERNDMVQYFAEQLTGFAVTEHGWVQSYGTRCVRPPIIFADVSRPQPMTVRWSSFAQSLSDKPVKGMLTGPVTMLNWSFVREDQPRSATCEQIALAIQDEVQDLIDAGLLVVQIDEPALREGLPLKRKDWDAYLEWTTAAFRLASSVAPPEIQIHTHMCYSEFGDVIGAIDALDADVLSIENARSGAEMLGVFRDFDYQKGVGPGVYDVHSPKVPSVEELVAAINATAEFLGPDRIWINPDCGLKTRSEQEVAASLANLVEATQIVRAQLASN